MGVIAMSSYSEWMVSLPYQVILNG